MRSVKKDKRRGNRTLLRQIEKLLSSFRSGSLSLSLSSLRLFVSRRSEILEWKINSFRFALDVGCFFFVSRRTTQIHSCRDPKCRKYRRYERAERPAEMKCCRFFLRFFYLSFVGGFGMNQERNCRIARLCFIMHFQTMETIFWRFSVCSILAIRFPVLVCVVCESFLAVFSNTISTFALRSFVARSSPVAKRTAEKPKENTKQKRPTSNA